LLLVAATQLETPLLRAELNLQPEGEGLWGVKQDGVQLHLLHTGIGMVNTAFALGQYLALQRADAGINFGIAGSFEHSLALGQVVEVVQDSFSELGAESPHGFLDLQKLGFPLLETEAGPLYNTLTNPHIKGEGEVARVSGITVNQVHGRAEHIANCYQRWACAIESMEGAAFFYAMLRAGIPFEAYRGISNYVETRNKSKWDIPLAARNVQLFVAQKVQQIIQRLSNSY